MASNAIKSRAGTLAAKEEPMKDESSTVALVRVLIVEDESSIAQAIGFIVEDFGCQPVFAANGQEALRLLDEQVVALIITDVMMPVMSGDVLIREVRSRTDASNIPPIVVMTAAGSSYAEQCGGDYLLEKPFDIEEVEDLLHHLLP